MRNIIVLVAVPGGRIRLRPQRRVGPVQLAGFRRRAPREVVLAGLGEKVVAGVLDAVGEKEPGRAFGDQGPVPRALTRGDLAPRRVEGKDGGAEVAGRPGPLGLEQPQQVQEVRRRVRGACGQPPRHIVQFGQQTTALVTMACPGLPGEGQPAQQAGHGSRVDAQGSRQQRHRRRGVLRQAGQIAEDGGGDRAADMRVEKRQRVVGVPVDGDRLTGCGGAFAAQHAS